MKRGNLFVIFLVFASHFMGQIDARSSAKKVRSSEGGGGEAAIPFLLISPNSRSGGIGEAGVAIPQSPSMAMHFNVAGLAYISDHGNEFGTNADLPVDLSYAQWLPNLKLDDLWYVYSAAKFDMEDIGTFGLSLRYLSYGEVIWTNSEGDREGSYDAKEYAISLAYSTKLSKNNYFGGAIKYIYSGIVESGIEIKSDVRVGSETTDAGSAVALDLGYYYLAGDLFGGLFKNTKIGASWNNIGPEISYIDDAQSDPLPIFARGGFVTTLVENDLSKLDFTYEAGLFTLSKVYRNQENIGDYLARIVHSGGLEYTYEKTFSIRFGGFFENKHAGGRQFLTSGLGFNVDSFVIDASYLIVTGESEHPLDGTTRFSFSFYL